MPLSPSIMPAVCPVCVSQGKPCPGFPLQASGGERRAGSVVWAPEKGPRGPSQQPPGPCQAAVRVEGRGGRRVTARTLAAGVGLCTAVMETGLRSSQQDGREAHSEPLFGISNVFFLHGMREHQGCVQRKRWGPGVSTSCSSRLFVSRTREQAATPLPSPLRTHPHSHSASLWGGAGLNPHPATRVGRPGWPLHGGSDVGSTLSTSFPQKTKERRL